jgi:hypothetical protein
VLHFVAGPRLTFHHESRFVPFAQVLFGGAYATTSARLTALPLGTVIPGLLPPGLVLDPNTPISTRLTASNTGFAMMAGGGLDIKISKHNWTAVSATASPYGICDRPGCRAACPSVPPCQEGIPHTAINKLFPTPRLRRVFEIDKSKKTHPLQKRNGTFPPKIG